MHTLNLEQSKALQYGIDVNKQKFETIIFVKTRNSLYKLIKQNGTMIIQGGKHFLVPTEVIFIGSTFGGSMIKIGWIGYGMKMEMVTISDDRKFTTSMVEAARLVGDGWEYDMEWENGKISTETKIIADWSPETD